jgi:hypothetical protein
MMTYGRDTEAMLDRLDRKDAAAERAKRAPAGGMTPQAWFALAMLAAAFLLGLTAGGGLYSTQTTGSAGFQTMTRTNKVTGQVCMTSANSLGETWQKWACSN